MKKILVPVDFSQQSQNAFKFAIDLADRGKFEVIALKVNDLPFTYERSFGMYPTFYDPNLGNELAEQSKLDFVEMKNMYPNDSVAVNFLVERGNITGTILNTIKDENIDLVIMGKQGAGGFEEFLMGSNTIKVIRTSPVPVIALKQPSDVSSIKNIVFPTTLELNQDHLIEKVNALQEVLDAKIHVVFINTPKNFSKDKEINERLESYSKHYKLKNYTLNVRNDVDEYEGIIGFAEEIHADMIAMKTHGRKGINQLLAGSIAEDLINHVHCPVWTYNGKKMDK